MEASNDKWLALELQYGIRCDFETNIAGYEGDMKLRLEDSAHLHAQHHPNPFDIATVVERDVQLGYLVQIGVQWEGFGGEYFWVEVTSIVIDVDGRPSYYGELKNNTQGAAWGSNVGPFQPRHICAIDYDWVLPNAA